MHGDLPQRGQHLVAAAGSEVTGQVHELTVSTVSQFGQGSPPICGIKGHVAPPLGR